MISRKNEGVKILPAKMSGWLSHALLILEKQGCSHPKVFSLSHPWMTKYFGYYGSKNGPSRWFRIPQRIYLAFLHSWQTCNDRYTKSRHYVIRFYKEKIRHRNIKFMQMIFCGEPYIMLSVLNQTLFLFKYLYFTTVLSMSWWPSWLSVGGRFCS